MPGVTIIGRPKTPEAKIICSNTPAIVRDLLLLEQFIKSWRIGGTGILLARSLNNMTIKAVFVPCVEGFAGKVSSHTMGTANNLIFFHSKVNLGAAGITEYFVKFRTKRVLYTFDDR